ncbi:diaminopimelate decarboxylase [Acinetobacter zhairhuonensis]|uniref:diaminopimelate decarboxylase n=1 Tax=Acinetobacter sp. A7.4 TaxID=2919921 RepID=UPI001F4F89D3|nr:diaminopimelate decarboxylase [Acinetobacter sp. A7.4]MCJ8162940.1 diaminopimelate decarboxylase [Acinetobacter sp. A7.4]
MNLTAETLFEVKQKFGTPTYIYDENQLRSSFNDLRNALPDCVDIFYALKVNPNLSVVKLINSYGGNTEVCSLAELEIAIKAGVDPQNIILLGPMKKEEEHRRALELNIFAVVVESEEELNKLSELASEMGVIAPVAIRINPVFSAKGSPWKMGGRPTHFGIEEETAVKNMGSYAKLPNIHLKGIHVYNGTKILEAQSVYDNSKYILDLFETVSNLHGLDLTMVDVGGGLGIKYYENEKDLDTQELTNLLHPLFNEFHKKHPKTRIIMESGRFIAGKSAALLVTVDNIKHNHGTNFAVTDGGTNCHSAAVGAGQVLKRNFEIVKVSAQKTDEIETYHISGPLCNPDDLLAKNAKLEKLKAGDLLAVLSSGAYGATASPTLFHSHGYPAEVLHSNGSLHLVRYRDTVEDIISMHTDISVEQLLGQEKVIEENNREIITDETQSIVASIVSQILKLPKEKMITSNSHLRDDLGIDSLSSVEILVALEDEIEHFFVNPETIEPKHFNTIETLASYIEAEKNRFNHTGEKGECHATV